MLRYGILSFSVSSFLNEGIHPRNASALRAFFWLLHQLRASGTGLKRLATEISALGPGGHHRHSRRVDPAVKVFAADPARGNRPGP